MNEENMNEKFSIVISGHDDYKYKDKLSKKKLELYKNKIVLFKRCLSDLLFSNGFLVTYFGSSIIELGYINIYHKIMTTYIEKPESSDILYFLNKDYISKDKFNKSGKILGEDLYILDNLKCDYLSIGNYKLYDKLIETFNDDKIVNGLLSVFNEITTIKDNERIKGIIEKIKSKDCYGTFLTTSIIKNEQLVDFTIFKNDIGIEDNSYYILKNPSEYFDKIKTNIDGFYDWAFNNDLSIEEAKQVFDFIEENPNEKIEKRDEILYKFKNKYTVYPEFTEEIDKILGINEDFYEAIRTIKEILKVKEGELEILEIGHYTSLETIKKLIKNKNKNNDNENNKVEGAYLRLTNGRQMNDPLEGKILLDYILDKNKNLGKSNNSKNWKPTFWYLSSATTELDSLPMWKQYGEDAKGGMLVYNYHYLKDIVELGYAEIYKVSYVNIDNDEIKVLDTNNIKEKDTTKLKEAIEKLREEIERLRKNENEKDYLPILSDIAFLFKKADYSYEKEYRIVVNRADNEKEIEEQNNPNYIFPFLYTYLKDIELKYSKVILGPKAVDIDYVAPYINYCDKDIEIERSSISYR